MTLSVRLRASRGPFMRQPLYRLSALFLLDSAFFAIAMVAGMLSTNHTFHRCRHLWHCHQSLYEFWYLLPILNYEYISGTLIFFVITKSGLREIKAYVCHETDTKEFKDETHIFLWEVNWLI